VAEQIAVDEDCGDVSGHRGIETGGRQQLLGVADELRGWVARRWGGSHAHPPWQAAAGGSDVIGAALEKERAP
jgi:hypothetical protein